MSLVYSLTVLYFLLQLSYASSLHILHMSLLSGIWFANIPYQYGIFHFILLMWQKF